VNSELSGHCLVHVRMATQHFVCSKSIYSVGSAVSIAVWCPDVLSKGCTVNKASGTAHSYQEYMHF